MTADAIRHALGWSLLHFLWQGAFLAALFALLLRMARRETPAHRYRMACATLAAMMLVPLWTLCELLKPRPDAWPLFFSAAAQTAAPSAAPAILQSGAHSVWKELMPALNSHLWVAEILWSIGLGWTLARILGALVAVRRMLAGASELDSPESQQVVQRIAATIGTPGLGVSHPSHVLISASVTTPVVVGLWRPVVLLPPGFFAALSSHQAEAILAHEYAHLQRRDPLINALQLFVEATLFFHPAVWWVSRQIRREREYCCDDTAIAFCGSPVLYSKALLALEESRTPLSPQFFPGIFTGDMSMRIHRLFTEKKTANTSTRVAIAACAVLAASCLALLSHAAIGQVQAASEPAKQPLAVVKPDNGNAKPDLACTYYDTSTTPLTAHESSCEITRSTDGPFYCVSPEDPKQKNKQVACGWKVKRYLDWEARQPKHDTQK